MPSTTCGARRQLSGRYPQASDFWSGTRVRSSLHFPKIMGDEIADVPDLLQTLEHPLRDALVIVHGLLGNAGDV